MNPIHEGGVIPHFRREWTQKMRDALLLLNINIEVPDHDKAPISADLVLSTAELTGCHASVDT